MYNPDTPDVDDEDYYEDEGRKQNQNWFTTHLRRANLWIYRNKALTVVLLLVLFLGIAGTVAWSLRPQEQIVAGVEEEKKPDPALPIPEKIYYSPLTGRKVKDEKTTKRQVTGVIIENSPDARPQSGMKDGGVIYEAIAEAGITRFLVVYQEATPQILGPVRSLRPYFVHWLKPYDASYAHVGGSFKALQEVRNGKYRDIDQFFNPDTFYRSTDRFAPHNVYTSFQRLDKINKSKGYVTSKFESLPRKPDAPSTGPQAKRIDVNMSSATYNSNYTYDAKTNSYLRFQDGEPHIDRESKKQLNPKVVVVMNVQMSLGFEDGYREQIKTSGKGQAFVFQDGNVEKVTWLKQSAASPLKFSKNNRPLQLNAGQTWIAAIPSKEGNVTWR